MTSLLRISALFIVLSFSVAHAGKTDLDTDKQAIGTACKKDADKIGCKGGMGSGMGKCMFAYKRNHKDWSPSPGCKKALKKLRRDNGGYSPRNPGKSGQTK